MQKDSGIFVAGHRGLVGSAICRELLRQGFTNLIVRAHADLDLTDRASVLELFHQEKPEYVFLAAGKVGELSRGSSLGMIISMEFNPYHRSPRRLAKGPSMRSLAVRRDIGRKRRKAA